MEKKVSIIIPVYNSERTINKCIQSLLNQTYKNLEIILINDGSTDSSRKICEEYQKENDNVKVINKNNEGPGRAREVGLEYARGEYISFIDSDDYVENNFYEDLVETLEKKNADIVQCGYNFVNTNYELIIKSKLRYQETIGKYNCARVYVSQKNITNYLCNKIYKRELFKDIEFKHFFAGEDACVLTQLYSNANKVLTIPENLYNYVQTDNSLCRNKFSLKRLDSVKAGEFMYKYQQKVFPDLADYYKLYICSYAGQCYCNLAVSNISDKEFYMKEMKRIFDKYFSITNLKWFKVSRKRFIFILMFKISPGLLIKFYRKREQK